MVKKRSSFAKMGVIILAVVMGLGLMGIGVSYWSESLDINAEVSTGSFGAQVISVGCYTDTPGSSISCNVVGSDVLELTVTNAQIGTNYSCLFNIANTGSIPVKVQSIVSNEPEGVVVGTAFVGPGSQIDPGGARGGVVQISLTPEPPDNPSEGTTFTFTVEFTFVQWDQYVP